MTLVLALRWVAQLLTSEQVPHVVAGGLAARAHGATRPLVDIDLYVPTRSLEPLAAVATEHVTRPPSRHVGEHWDITFMKVAYGGHQIEFGGSDDVRIRDGQTGTWVEQHIDYDRAQVLEVEGAVRVPVMPRDDLMAYKRLLDRPVDRMDVAQLTAT